jgi:hypothetical protein
MEIPEGQKVRDEDLGLEMEPVILKVIVNHKRTIK